MINYLSLSKITAYSPAVNTRFSEKANPIITPSNIMELPGYSYQYLIQPTSRLGLFLIKSSISPRSICYIFTKQRIMSDIKSKDITLAVSRGDDYLIFSDTRLDALLIHAIIRSEHMLFRKYHLYKKSH